MRDLPPGNDGPPVAQKEILVAVGGGPDAAAVVRFGKHLADGLGAHWHAVHIEKPSVGRDGHDPAAVAEALGVAAQLGASVAKIPAATVADGLAQHLEISPAGHLVVGHHRRARPPWRRSIAENLMRRQTDLVLHVVPSQRSRPAGRLMSLEAASLRSYAYAAGAVAVTLFAAYLLNRLAGIRSLGLLFLVPVIAAAARLGIKPALVAALLSALGYNFFFLSPAFVLKPWLVQSWFMGAVLLLVALYTGMLTSALRGRVALSDRSAQENAGIASFALELTRVSDWTATAETVCEQVGALLGVHTIVVREVSGSLEIAAAIPPGAVLAPLDQAALDWAWSRGEAAGSGTSVLAEASWQFHPLKTSLGTLAVVALARDDGRNPVPADRAVLLATLIAQAALAHERLRLEDIMRGGGQTRQQDR
ncbi:DUF4118 domain-containing protein [Sphingosinicella sp. YJ22]|uniref:DUF4118 domain-containing protein n=1 Tax=Sphingosinicella sp. YJ22 TaxID=1104780 RepID=UPI00140765FF|nr:DUF4118 domain-containing protein [Sphingosinicella sp. YJ22]